MADIKALDNNLLAQLWTKCNNQFMQRNGVPSSFIASEYNKTLNLAKINVVNVTGTSDSILLNANTNYTISFNANTRVYLMIRDYANSLTIYSGWVETGYFTYTFLNTYNSYIELAYYNNDTTPNITNIMLNEGTTALAYQPHYAPAQFTNEEGIFLQDEYKKSVNKLNINNYYSERVNVSISGAEISISVNNDVWAYVEYKIIPNIQYTISFDSVGSGKVVFSDNGNTLYNIDFSDGHFSTTFTSDNNYLRFYVSWGSAETRTTKLSNIMLNEGSVALPYVVSDNEYLYWKNEYSKTLNLWKWFNEWSNNSSTDTRTNFNLRISFNDQSVIAVNETYSSTGVKSVSFTTPSPINNITIKHNGSSRDIDILYIDNNGWLKPGTLYSFSFNLTGYNPQATNGISFNNIMLNEGASLPYTTYAGGDIMHKGNIYVIDMKDKSFTSNTSLAYTGYEITIPANCVYSLTLSANYNSDRPLTVAWCYTNNYNYQESVAVGGDYAYTLSTTTTGYSGTGRTLYAFARYGSSSSNSINITGYYIKLD